jgi:hypothetical protein
VFLEANPRFPLTALIGLLQEEERGVLRINSRNLRTWLERAGFESVSVELGPLYTPPGPASVERLLDRLDAALARIPLLRSLAIFYTAQGRAAPPA